jgi:hypothetical protein
MQFKNLIWIAVLRPEANKGREAIYNSVASTHNLPPSSAGIVEATEL